MIDYKVFKQKKISIRDVSHSNLYYKPRVSNPLTIGECYDFIQKNKLLKRREKMPKLSPNNNPRKGKKGKSDKKLSR